MAHILHIDSSARTQQSFSRKLTQEFVETWLKLHPEDTLTYRDLNTTPLPFLDERWVAAAFSPEQAEEHKMALTISNLLIDELVAADVLVLGVPVYNLSVPAIFKAYIDQIVRMGRTARYTATGPEGLLKGKQAYVIATSGSDFTQEPLKSLDHHTPYLKAILGFVGITDVTFIRHFGHEPQGIEQSLAEARGHILNHTRQGLEAQI